MSSQEWKNKNIDKIRESRRNWYRRNAEHAIAKTTERRRQLAKWFQEYKSSLSCSCGENHPSCISFHHEDVEKKEMELADMVHAGFSREKIMAEVAKCKVMCHNCHAKLHCEQNKV